MFSLAECMIIIALFIFDCNKKNHFTLEINPSKLCFALKVHFQNPQNDYTYIKHKYIFITTSRCTTTVNNYCKCKKKAQPLLTRTNKSTLHI